MHDLGKIGIPDAILRKPDKLTELELKIIKTHPLIGGKLINEHPLSSLVCRPILEHPERLDRKGYPCGLSSDQISLSSRIVGILDSFDAMTIRSHIAKHYLLTQRWKSSSTDQESNSTTSWSATCMNLDMREIFPTLLAMATTESRS